MAAGRIGEVAVIFTNRRTGADEAGYAAAAAEMDARAAAMPGYRGMASTPGPGGNPLPAGEREHKKTGRSRRTDPKVLGEDA